MGQTVPRIPIDFYRAERDQADREGADAASTARRLSRARLILILVVIGSIFAPRWTSIGVAWTIAVVSAAAFFAAVQLHRRARDRERIAWSRGRSARDGIARIERNWDDLAPSPPLTEMAPWSTRVANDLGVVGDRSLIQLLGAPNSRLGAQRLLHWLLDDPAPLDVIQARQASVASLRDRSGLLFDVAAASQRGGERSQTARAIPAFVAWCEDQRTTRNFWISRAVSVFFVALGVSGAVMRSDVGNALITIAIVGQLTVTGRARSRINASSKGIESAVTQLDGLVRITDVIVVANDADGQFGEIQRSLRTENVTSSLRAFVRLLAWNDVRYSPLSHWALNTAIGFDVHLEAALESARAHHRSIARHWIDELSSALALLSLSTLAFEHPDWTIPTVDDGMGAPPLAATSLAHPLLGESAVANDVSLPAPGTAVIVSGPNMAGKTTYLRAIGVNMLLAQAGGAVRARRMQLSRCRVRSSIRVEDDLGHGISLFLAEILRARDIVRDAENRNESRVVFLFDEILHGTNAEDRRLATRSVLERLMRAGAVGIVTTHDPGIAAGDARHVHFDAEIGRDVDGRPTLGFDYRATPGPAVRTNALALMDLYLNG